MKVIIFAGGWGTMTYGDATGDSYQVNEPVNTKLDEAWTEQFAKPGKYWTAGEAQPFRPMPGVKDLSVEYKGGGMRLGATRTAEISWTCWTWQELDNYRPHFLHHGKTILLEWGWSGDGIIWEREIVIQSKSFSISDQLIGNGSYNLYTWFHFDRKAQCVLNNDKNNYKFKEFNCWLKKNQHNKCGYLLQKKKI